MTILAKKHENAANAPRLSGGTVITVDFKGSVGHSVQQQGANVDPLNKQQQIEAGNSQYPGKDDPRRGLQQQQFDYDPDIVKAQARQHGLEL